MDIEKKYDYAKKAAIAAAGGAIAAGAHALSKKGGALMLDSLQAGEDMPAQEMEAYNGEYGMTDEGSAADMGQETAGQEMVAPSPVSLDDLSFGEAFRAARQVCGGGGGVFEWHGNYYNTYTKNEYEQLTEDDMDNLYDIYKQIANGDTDKLISSLGRTITTECTRQTTASLEEMLEEVYADSGTEDNCYNDQAQDSDYDDSDTYDEDMEDLDDQDSSFSSELDDIDFNNLYS